MIVHRKSFGDVMGLGLFLPVAGTYVSGDLISFSTQDVGKGRRIRSSSPRSDGTICACFAATRRLRSACCAGRMAMACACLSTPARGR